MKEKTIDEEIPVTDEGLSIYYQGLKKEMSKVEPTYKRLKLVMNKVEEILDKKRNKK